MKTVEAFELKQSKMSDRELIDLCQKEVGELASTYGKSHRMTIPPMITDTDMLLSELIKRFKMLSEAMRWRDPKKERPEDGKLVITRIGEDANSVDICRYKNGRYTLYIQNQPSHYTNKPIFREELTDYIIGWRPIE